MNKLLLATTALVASAGFAAADIELSGDAAAGLLIDGSSIEVYNGANATLSMTGSSDNGLEFGTSISLAAVDNARDGFSTTGSDTGVSGGAVWISSGGLTATIDVDGVDDLYSDTYTGHDLGISYAAGGITFDATMDLNDTFSDSAMSYSVGYSSGAVSASLAGNDIDCMSISAGYSTDTVGITVTNDNACGGTAVNTVEVSYTGDGFTAGAEIADDDSWTISGSTTTGSTTLSAEMSSGSTWEVTASVDAGGGLSIEAGINDASVVYLGGAMSF